MLGNSLTLRLSFVIVGIEFHRSVSGKVLKRAEMPLTKSNRISESEAGGCVTASMVMSSLPRPWSLALEKQRKNQSS